MRSVHSVMLLALAPVALFGCGGNQKSSGDNAAGGAGGTGASAGVGGADACVDESDATFCARLGRNCGSVTDDGCSGRRTVASCGTCTAPATCGGTGTPGVCGICTPETDAAFCSRLGKNCGGVAADDNCGTARTVASCGMCTSPQACESGQCGTGYGPSCNGLAETCGPDGNASCCVSSLIPGGTFYRSYDGLTFTDKSYPATISDFRLDLHEITVGRFRNFVAAYPGNMPTAGAGKNPNNPSDPGWSPEWNTDGSMPADQTALITAVKCDSGFQTWTDSPAGNETRPMNCIS